MDGLTKVKVQLPYPHSGEFGPGWCDVWTRDAVGSDQSVIDEIFIEDVYRIRGLDKSGWADPGRGPVIDAGANIGGFSLAALAYHAREVIAIEPSPPNLAVLQANLAGRARVLTTALTGDGRPVKLSGEGGGTRIDAEQGVVEVESVTLRSLLEPLNKVAFLKMDIEGGEYEVILSTPHAELAKVDRIAMEWHSSAMMDGGEMPPLGKMLEWLAETHSLDCVGRASVGGMLFANSYSS